MNPDMHNHTLEPLYSTDQGTVLRCRSCGRTNVFFGAIILSQQAEGLDALRRVVDDLEPITRADLEVGARRYMLRTPDRQIGFAFTEEEINELRDLLAGASTMAELSGLLEETLGTGSDSNTGDGTEAA